MKATRDLRELVLAAVSNDIEAFDTILELVNDEDVARQYSKDEVLACTRKLLEEGYLHAWMEHSEEARLVPAYDATSTPEEVERYWYKPSDAGRSLRDELRNT
jgi:hypothetical protein